MELLTTVIARVLFAVPFLVMGVLHFTMAEMMAGAVPAWLPGGIFWVYFIGVCLFAAGVSIATTKMAALACKLLAVLLLVFIVTVHGPGLMMPEHMAMAMSGLLKDTGLMGAALAFSRIFERG